MKTTNGNILITVEQTVQERLASGLYQDVRFNKHAKMNICGQIVAVPESGNDEALADRYEGMPRRLHQRSEPYNARDYKCDFRVGDTVYFHYLTLEDEFNFLMQDGGRKLFRVKVSDCFCAVRDGKIIMNLNWVLGVPYWGEGLEDLGDGLKGLTKQMGEKKIVTRVVMKPEVDIGQVRHIGPGVYEQRQDVEAGDVVLLTPNCEFENKIEGLDYWVFRHEDILAVKRGDLIYPCGDYVLIQTDRKSYGGGMKIPQLDYLETPYSGVVIMKGANSKLQVKRGDPVLYSKRDMRLLMGNVILIREGNIVCG